MEQQTEASPLLVSDRVVVNGTITPLTLSEDGVLRWSEGSQRCLIVEKQVLGFDTDGPKIKIRAAVEAADRICCVGTRTSLLRKNFVFEVLSEDMQRLWCQKLRDYIDALGNYCC